MREEWSDEIDKPRKSREGGSGRAKAVKYNKKKKKRKKKKLQFNNFQRRVVEVASSSPFTCFSFIPRGPDPRRTSRAQPNLWGPGADP